MPTRSLSLRLTLLSVLLLLTAPVALPAQSAGQTPTQSSAPTETQLTGVVLNSLDHSPIPRVLVTSPTGGALAQLTDAEGRFSFTYRGPLGAAPTSWTTFSSSGILGPDSGPLLFTLRKPGFLPNTIGVPIPTSNAPIQLTLTPAATLTGQVYADRGDLPERVAVQLYARSAQSGLPKWNPIRGANVDASGRFRVSGLGAGDYKLSTTVVANPSPGQSGAGSISGFRPTFYPNTDSLDSAAPIHLAAGDTARANLTLRATTLYAVTIPIAAAAAPGGTQPGAQPADQPASRIFANLVNGSPTLQLIPNGHGSVTGYLPSGSYDVQLGSWPINPVQPVRQGGQPVKPASFQIATIHLQIDDHPVQLPPVALHPAPEVPVNVHVETSTPPPSQFQIAHPVAIYAIDSGNGLPPQQWQSPDEFVLMNLAPGVYHLVIQPTTNAYIASATSGETDLLRDPLTVVDGAAPAPIEITLRDDFASLNLHLPAAQPLYILGIPLDRPESYAFTFANGGAQNTIPVFPHPAPGRYLFLASQSNTLFSLAYRDPEVLNSLLTKGAIITLAASQKADLDVPLLPEDALP